MVVSCGLIKITGGWAEFSSTFGFQPWNTLEWPCWACTCNAATMQEDEDMDVVSDLWTPVAHDTYETACVACEQLVELTAETQLLLEQHLTFNHKDYGGRVLDRDIPSLNLFMGDRLEPSESLQDVGGLLEL